MSQYPPHHRAVSGMRGLIEAEARARLAKTRDSKSESDFSSLRNELAKAKTIIERKNLLAPLRALDSDLALRKTFGSVDDEEMEKILFARTNELGITDPESQWALARAWSRNRGSELFHAHRNGLIENNDISEYSLLPSAEPESKVIREAIDRYVKCSANVREAAILMDYADTLLHMRFLKGAEEMEATFDLLAERDQMLSKLAPRRSADDMAAKCRDIEQIVRQGHGEGIASTKERGR